MSLSAGGGPRTRRARKAQRELDAELDKLTVRARLATVSARHLDSATLNALFARLKDQALNDSGHVARQAAETLIRLAKESVVDEDDQDTDAISLEDMTPAQRAAFRARVERRLLELDEELEGQSGEADAADGTPSRRE
jgi:low affinity Fe/Cu permease